MGVWGWDEIKDNQTLQGFVRGKANYQDDGDWTFSVQPATNYKHLLTNPSGFTNTNSLKDLIECEVEPPDELGGDDAESQATLDKYMNNGARKITDKWVTIVGPWVRDRSHSYAGEQIGVSDDGDTGKTEIHPIISMLVEHPPADNNQSRLIDFFVFSDDSENFPATVPHSDENRLGAFDILVPRASSFMVLSELTKSEPSHFGFVDSGPFWLFQGRVKSGKASEGKGFFHATIELRPGFTVRTFLSSRRSDPQLGIRRLMPAGGSVRYLFGGKLGS
jgi:hypothetical protein